jgi:hypothetical protein
MHFSPGNKKPAGAGFDKFLRKSNTGFHERLKLSANGSRPVVVDLRGTAFWNYIHKKVTLRSRHGISAVLIRLYQRIDRPTEPGVALPIKQDAP